MRSKRLVPLATALILLLFLWSQVILAQEREESSASEWQSEAPKGSSMEIGRLPTQLSDNHRRALQELRPAVSSGSPMRRHMRAAFFNSASQHPLTPREVALRESVYELASHPKQYAHVRLADGKVLTGTISNAHQDTFQVRSHILGDGHTVRYDQLAEPPRPVLAAGTRAVKGLEVTGLVALCIVAIPLIVALYPLILTGIISDC
jgi:hypothetical protein